MAEGVPATSPLRVLELEWCGVGDRAAVVLARMLRNNNGLARLSLANNRVGERGRGHRRNAAPG